MNLMIGLIAGFGVAILGLLACFGYWSLSPKLPANTDNTLMLQSARAS